MSQINQRLINNFQQKPLLKPAQFSERINIISQLINKKSVYFQIEIVGQKEKDRFQNMQQIIDKNESFSIVIKCLSNGDKDVRIENFKKQVEKQQCVYQDSQNISEYQKPYPDSYEQLEQSRIDNRLPYSSHLYNQKNIIYSQNSKSQKIQESSFVKQEPIQYKIKEQDYSQDYQDHWVFGMLDFMHNFQVQSRNKPKLQQIQRKYEDDQKFKIQSSFDPLDLPAAYLQSIFNEQKGQILNQDQKQEDQQIIMNLSTSTISCLSRFQQLIQEQCQFGAFLQLKNRIIKCLNKFQLTRLASRSQQSNPIINKINTSRKIAQQYQQKQDWDKALQYYHHSLTYVSSRTSEMYIKLKFQIQTDIAKVQYAQQKYNKAKLKCKQILQHKTLYYEPQSRQLADTYQLLGQLNIKLQEFSQGVQHFNKTFQLIRKHKVWHSNKNTRRIHKLKQIIEGFLKSQKINKKTVKQAIKMIQVNFKGEYGDEMMQQLKEQLIKKYEEMNKYEQLDNSMSLNNLSIKRNMINNQSQEQ